MRWRLSNPHNQDGDKSSSAVHQRIDHLNRLAWELSDTDSKQAYALSEEAFALASSPQDGDGAGAAIDQVGIAFSLRTQGYLNMRLGDYPLGLSQLTRALAIFESLGRA